MKKQNLFFISATALLFAVSVAMAQGVSCCEWGRLSIEDPWSCIGDCEVAGLLCTQTGYNHSSDQGICACISEGACRYVEDECTGSCDTGYVCDMIYDAQQDTDYCVCEPEQTECHWDGEGCSGDCPTGQSCEETGFQTCGCQPIVGECEWDNVSQSCQGACSPDYPCLQTGYDFEMGQGICECRSPDACRWFKSEESYCAGTCEQPVDSECTKVVYPTKEVCECKGPVPVPEFTTATMVAAILLVSPAFAYLLIRKRR